MPVWWVRYQLLEPPLMVVACHCSECQKLSTSAFSITAVVKSSSVVFSGEMSNWSRACDSGNVNAAKFFPTCGNRLYHFDPSDSSTFRLKPSNLSDTRIIEPTMHVWVSEKQDWFEIPEGAKTFEGQP